MLSEKWLRKKYLEQGLSQSEIAKLLGISQQAVYWWMKKFNIKARESGFLGKNHSEKAKQKISESQIGEKNHGWKGGKESYYGRIARRAWEEYWREKVPDGYLLHHIDEDRRNNDICNLALLTLSFHTSLHNEKRKNNGWPLLRPHKDMVHLMYYPPTFFNGERLPSP